MLPATLSIYILMSLLTFVAYAIDKHRAYRGGWRTREKTLHLLALAGGFSGAIVAQQVLKHKRRKRGFMAITWLIVLAHAAGWAVYLYLRRSG